MPSAALSSARPGASSRLSYGAQHREAAAGAEDASGPERGAASQQVVLGLAGTKNCGEERAGRRRVTVEAAPSGGI